MPSYNIRIEIENPVLSRLITEQMATLKTVIIDNDCVPDCVITQMPQNLNSTGKTITLNLPVKGVIRLGEITDRLGYLLSGREDHIEDDNSQIDLGHFILRLSENSMIHKKSGELIQLTDKERMLMRYLYQAGNSGILRKDLLRSVWGYAEEAETHTLETHIYRLRQKLEKYNAGDLIKAEDGRYMIVHTS